MATRTQSRSGGSNDDRGESARRQPRDSDGQFKSASGSPFKWSGGQTGIVLGAAVAGAAVGLAANMGRKLFVQFASTGGASWDEALATEHRMTLMTFDKIEATDDSQTTLRSQLLAKLKYQLTKHALEEENVIYPALRQANSAHDADVLESEHGYVKTYLYELETMPNGTPEWLARVRDFRTMIEEHMRMEENEVFPALKRMMSEEQSSRLTAMMNKEGFKFA
ncbi:MAG TPA: hemerythrin domain-containing protein [Allosphingosinicella sp.]|nr:hemerythrin domain-containing protein [Allosphingosinicella sp.]